MTTMQLSTKAEWVREWTKPVRSRTHEWFLWRDLTPAMKEAARDVAHLRQGSFGWRACGGGSGVVFTPFPPEPGGTSHNTPESACADAPSEWAATVALMGPEAY